MAKKANPQTIEDITEHCDRKCILKMMALRAWDDRTLEQIRCIGLYKDEIEDIEGKKYTLTEITHKWNEIYGEKFAQIYKEHKEHLKAKAIYNMVRGREPLENGFE